MINMQIWNQFAFILLIDMAHSHLKKQIYQRFGEYCLVVLQKTFYHLLILLGSIVNQVIGITLNKEKLYFFRKNSYLEKNNNTNS